MLPTSALRAVVGARAGKHVLHISTTRESAEGFCKDVYARYKEEVITRKVSQLFFYSGGSIAFQELGSNPHGYHATYCVTDNISDQEETK